MINNFLTWEENNVNMQADAAPPEGDAMGTPPAVSYTHLTLPTNREV